MIRNSISQLEEQAAINRAAIMNHFKKFYSNCLDYLEELREERDGTLQ